MTEPDRHAPWYEGITGYQWLVFLIASAGWVFDVYEGQLFTIYKSDALRAVLARDGGASAAAIEWHANVGLALFLVGGAVGGLAFGMLGDRIGRVRVMSLTILVYSIFSALTSFAQTAWQVDILRFFVALGTGGEWAVAAAMVAEMFPPRARALASGAFHASSVLGVVLASATGMFLKGPDAWRTGFLLGLAPAILILLIRMCLREPPGWQEARREAAARSGQRLGSLAELLGDPAIRSRALIGLGLAAVGLSTYWGIFAWAPELMGEVLGQAASADERRASGSFAYLLMNLTGGLLGLLSFAPLADWKGRRFAFAVFHLGALVLVPTTFLLARTSTQVLWMLPVMGFFVLGMHAGYAIYFPELFPTRLRATGASFCFNVGRLISALLLLVRGAMRATLDLRWAVTVMAGVFLIGLILLIFAPETRGKPLEE